MEVGKWTEKYSVDDTVGREEGERDPERKIKLLEEEGTLKEKWKGIFLFSVPWDGLSDTFTEI